MKTAITNTEGKIRKGATEYILNCANNCGRQEVNHLYSQKQFIEYLKKDAWKKVGGLWFCRWCTPRKAKP